jgi:hypothetical protein
MLEITLIALITVNPGPLGLTRQLIYLLQRIWLYLPGDSYAQREKYIILISEFLLIDIVSHGSLFLTLPLTYVCVFAYPFL